MEKREELLLIEPANELRFRGPFTKPVITLMKLTNPTDHTILFKIKTTAPKKYCVRPNFGSVMPKSNTKVEICLQTFAYDPNEKNKHKFMVQSLVAPDGVSDYGKLWREVEPNQLMDAKLKCVFEMPAEAPDADNAAPNEVVTKEVLLMPYHNADLFSLDSPFSSESHFECAETHFSHNAPKEVVTNEASPIPVAEEKPTDYQSDNLLAEIRQLKHEGSELREENLTLKNQLMRIKYTTSQQRIDEPYLPAVEKQIPMFYIALCIVTAIFGIFLGKFLL